MASNRSDYVLRDGWAKTGRAAEAVCVFLWLLPFMLVAVVLWPLAWVWRKTFYRRQRK